MFPKRKVKKKIAVGNQCLFDSIPQGVKSVESDLMLLIWLHLCFFVWKVQTQMRPLRIPTWGV